MPNIYALSPLTSCIMLTQTDKMMLKIKLIIKAKGMNVYNGIELASSTTIEYGK